MHPSPNAVAVCKEIGIDISEKTSHFIYDYELSDFEKVYCMSEEHYRILTQSVGLPPEKAEVLDIADPYGQSVAVYRFCRDMIQTAVEQIISSYED